MIQINELSFDNDDIGRLAIHLGRTHGQRPAEAIPFTGTGAAQSVYSGAGILVGYTAANTDAAGPHQLSVIDGQDATGQPLILDSLVASDGRGVTFAQGGVQVRRGLAVNTDTTVVGVLYLVRRNRLG